MLRTDYTPVMKFVIPGGSGQVGTLLARAFQRDGHEVVILSRRAESTAPWRTIPWDAKTLGPWTAEFEGADVIINLAGRSVNCRYTPHQRSEITNSRIDSTRVVGEAIAHTARPPRVWLQASTATIYAHRYDEPNDESSGIIGGNEPGVPETWRFSIGVAKGWEKAADDAGDLPNTRKVLLRSAITLSPDAGGIFDVLLRLVRFGLGGTSGDGRQFVSWIHENDFIQAIYWLIEHDALSGAINLASPNPVPNAEFMRTLRKSWGMPIGLPAFEWMLEIGAIFLRTETELVLKSRRVVPGRLQQSGFRFTLPHWSDAARELCARWRREHSSAS